MSVYKIQGKTEKRKGIYYEFDSEDIPLGEGGMGKVYRGRCVDEKTGEVYADMTKIFNQSVVRRTNTQRKR